MWKVTLLLVLLGLAVGAGWMIWQDRIRPPTPVEVDPDLQALVDDWRDADAQAADRPGEWDLAELQRFKDSRAREQRRLDALRQSYEAAEARAATADRGEQQQASWDATSLAGQAKLVRSEIARLDRLIAASEARLGLDADRE